MMASTTWSSGSPSAKPCGGCRTPTKRGWSTRPSRSWQERASPSLASGSAGGGEDVAQRHARGACDARAVLVLGRRELALAKVLDFDAYLAPRRHNAPLGAPRNQPLDGLESYAQRGRVFEDQPGEPLTVLGTAKHAHQHTWPVLLHLQRAERDIQRTSFQQTLHREPELLGRGVVQVG